MAELRVREDVKIAVGDRPLAFANEPQFAHPARQNNRDKEWVDLIDKPAAEREQSLASEGAYASLKRDVLSLAARKLTAEQHSEFREFMTRFDQRSNLAIQERGGTLLQVFRLLNATTGAAPEDSRCLLAKLVLQNAACPNRIDQGAHNTCNVTSLETRCYSRYPSIASSLVADVALKGSFTTTNGSVITLASLEKDLEAHWYKIDSGQRNYASQLFQLVAVNVYWKSQDTMPDGKYAGKGNILYAQESGNSSSTGEYILNRGVSPPQRFTLRNGGADAPQIDVEELVDINTQIVGKVEEDLILERNSSARKKGLVSVDSPADLRNVLTRLKNEKKFPVVLVVDAAMPPFGSAAEQSSKFARHAVTVTDYEISTGKVTVDNQYGVSKDLTDKPGEKPRAGVEELYQAMRTRPPFDHVFSDIWKNLKRVDLHDFYRASAAGGAMTAVYACGFARAAERAPGVALSASEYRLLELVAREKTAMVERRLERLVSRDQLALGRSGLSAEQRLAASGSGVVAAEQSLTSSAVRLATEPRLVSATGLSAVERLAPGGLAGAGSAVERRMLAGGAAVEQRLLSSGVALAEAAGERRLAGTALAAEARLGSSLVWRAGSTLAAGAVVVGVTDLGKAFSEGTEHGVGATGRILMASLGYELGFGIAADVVKRTGTKWLPAKVVVPVTFGLACATAYDTALGENFEKLFRTAYRRSREYFRPVDTLRPVTDSTQRGGYAYLSNDGWSR